LSALFDVLAEGGATTVARAVPAVAALPELAACTDRAALERRAVLLDNPETRDRVVTLRRDLARVAGLERAGRFAEGLQRAEATVTAAEALAYPPVRIAGRPTRGRGGRGASRRGSRGRAAARRGRGLAADCGALSYRRPAL
jgi:serine/threonine-protein kinase